MRAAARSAVLLAAVVLAGCTAPSGGTTSGEPAASGLVIQQASLQNTAIPVKGGTELVLRLANTQPKPVTDLRIRITNTDGLRVRRDGAKSDPKCPPRGGTVGSLPGATGGVPTQLLCVYDIKQNRASPGRYPVTVSITYLNTLTMQQASPKITFDPEQQTPAAKISRSFSNGELSMTVEFPPRLPTRTTKLQTTVSAANTGSGRIVGSSSDNRPGRRINLGFRGTLKSAAGFAPSGNRCGPLIVRDGESQASTTCELTAPGQITQLTTHNLRISATYRYRLRRELPLQVVTD